MEERELLELAAKAEGRHPPYDSNGVFSAWVGGCDTGHWWNPLADDGDALRLAVKLRLTIDIVEWGTSCQHWTKAGDTTDDRCLRHAEHPCDPAQATRHAIVRAAAEIGRSMP